MRLDSLSRRSFLRTSTLTSAALLLGQPGRSQQCNFAPPFLITIGAPGGWDTTTTVDPHGVGEFSPYSPSDIISVGGLRVAPFDALAPVKPYMVRRFLRDETGAIVRVANVNQTRQVDFFAENASTIRVLNGVDNNTVGHATGAHYSFTGHLREGMPCLGSLLAGALNSDAALPFLSFGGVDASEGLVPGTRVNSSTGSILRALGRPATNGGAPIVLAAREFIPRTVQEGMLAVQAARDARRGQALLGRRALLNAVRGHDALSEGRLEGPSFESIANALDSVVLGADTNTLVSSISLALLCMRLTPTACHAAQLISGEFDSHVNINGMAATGHRPQMKLILEGIDFLIDEIENNPANAAIKERGMLVYVASDFGRTRYNDEDGKDHWQITSSMIIGIGAMAQKVDGGTVLGQTTPLIDGVVQPGLRAKPMRIDDNGRFVLADSFTSDDPNFATLKPGDVIAALRQGLGLDCQPVGPGQSTVTEQFPIPDVNPGIARALAAGINPLLKNVS